MQSVGVREGEAPRAGLDASPVGGLCQLADYAGVGLRFVRELEQGKVSLRLDKVNQVLDLFSACVGPVPIDRSVYAEG